MSARLDPHIPELDRAEADEAGLSRRMERFATLGDSDADFVRLLARAPGYAEALWDAMAMSLFEGNVEHSLKEIIRIQLAHTAQDPYFSQLRSKQAITDGLTEDRIAAALGDFSSDPTFTEAEKWALTYAHEMYRNPESVDGEFYARGKKHFSEAQIMEIGGLIAIHYGMQVFMRTMGGAGSS